jgi:hypothetical protein
MTKLLTSPLRAVCAAASLFMLATAEADVHVYKCVDQDGRTEYRDSLCVGNVGEQVTLRPNVTSPIDQSAAQAANSALSARISARMRLEEEQAMRQQAFGPAIVGAPPPFVFEPGAAEYGLYDYGVYGYVPPARGRGRRDARTLPHGSNPSRSVIFAGRGRH